MDKNLELFFLSLKNLCMFFKDATLALRPRKGCGVVSRASDGKILAPVPERHAHVFQGRGMSIASSKCVRLYFEDEKEKGAVLPLKTWT